MLRRRGWGVLAAALVLAGAGCRSAEKEKARQVQEEVRLLEEQTAALDEENASLKASVASLQLEVSRLNAELASEGARISRMKTSVVTLKELTAPQSIWKKLWRALVFLFKLALLLGLGGGVYYFYLQSRQRQAGEEISRLIPGSPSAPAQGGSGSNPPGPGSGATEPGSSADPSAASGASDPDPPDPAAPNRAAAADRKRCQVPGCLGRHRSKGYCNKHYQQFRKGLLPEVPEA